MEKSKIVKCRLNRICFHCGFVKPYEPREICCPKCGRDYVDIIVRDDEGCLVDF